MKAGRPSKYKKKYCKEIIEYFQKDPTREVVVEHFSQKTGQKIDIIEEKPNGPPTLYGFAASIEVCHDTLNEWKTTHPEFSAAIKKAKALQADFVVHNAMTGNSPAAFSIFMMKNNHGWKDKQEIDTTLKVSGLDDKLAKGRKKVHERLKEDKNQSG